MGATTPTLNPPISALPGYLIVQPFKEEQNERISVSYQYGQKDNAGVVLVVGPGPYKSEFGTEFTLPDVKPGDTVIHNSFSQTIYVHHGLEIRFVRFCDVMALIKES